MNSDQRFNEAIEKIDAANREDPRREMVGDRPAPRELLFAQRVYDWVQKLVPHASESLLLAARAHTIRRWKIPRDRYPMTTVGYHKWRDALAHFHAEEAAAILGDVGYTDDEIGAVSEFITKKNWPENAEALALEDADCLVFLETKLPSYVDEWGEAKSLRILQRTIKKMTPEARTRAAELNLGRRERELLQQAAQDEGA